MATRYSLSQPATLNSLAVYLSTNDTDPLLRMMVYSDSGGVPQTLITSSTIETVVNGWNHWDVPVAVLPSGNFWLAFQILPSGGGNIVAFFDTGAANTESSTAVPFNSSYVNYPAAANGNHNYSIYGVFCPGPTNTPTFSPTASSTSTSTPTVTATSTITATLVVGKDWIASTHSAAFSPRTDHSSVIFNNKMWVIAGNLGSVAANDCWSSSEGATWTAATHSAAFPARSFSAAVSFNGKMWIIGGVDAGGNPFDDVWSSPDGITWSAATTTAAFGARFRHLAMVMNNEMWVVGGYNFDTSLGFHDAWHSADGITWSAATTTAAYSARYESAGFEFTAFTSGMVLIGGSGGVGVEYQDVYSSSADGVTWTQQTASGGFGGRADHTACFYNSSLYAFWVIGGRDSSGNILSDVWASADLVNWTQATANAAFGERYGHTTVVFDNGTGNKMWVIGGYLGPSNGNQNDVWHSP